MEINVKSKTPDITLEREMAVEVFCEDENEMVYLRTLWQKALSVTLDTFHHEQFHEIRNMIHV